MSKNGKKRFPKGTLTQRGKLYYGYPMYISKYSYYPIEGACWYNAECDEYCGFCGDCGCGHDYNLMSTLVRNQFCNKSSYDPNGSPEIVLIITNCDDGMWGKTFDSVVDMENYADWLVTQGRINWYDYGTELGFISE